MVHLVKDSVDGQWLTFPFPFVHHQPRPYLSWSTSVFSFSWSKGERTGEDRRLSTVETRTFLHGWPCPLASKLLIARGRHWPATKRYSRQNLVTAFHPVVRDFYRINPQWKAVVGRRAHSWLQLARTQLSIPRFLCLKGFSPLLGID